MQYLTIDYKELTEELEKAIKLYNNAAPYYNYAERGRITYLWHAFHYTIHHSGLDCETANELDAKYRDECVKIMKGIKNEEKVQ